MSPRLSYLEIARLEEARQAIGTAEVADVAEPLAGGWMCFAGKGSWANQACGLGLAGPVSDTDLDRLVGFYASRGVEPRIEVCPFAEPSLIAGLAARGFVVREFENVLATEIDAAEDLRARLPRGWPAGVEVRAVDPEDADEVRLFADVSGSGFRPAGTPPSEVELKTAARVATHPRCDSFFALAGGAVAGASGMETSGAVAALFGTSVPEACRRRGIQAALIVRRLERARERGARLAVIHSRPGIPTERNAARLGFFMAYSKVLMVMPGPGLEPSP